MAENDPSMLSVASTASAVETAEVCETPTSLQYTPDITYIPRTIPSCCREQKDLKKVCKECVKSLLEHHEPVCKNIRDGTCFSRRHQQYKTSSMRDRVLLDKEASRPLRIFSEEVDNFVVDWMMENFENANWKEVLKMELFLRVLMDFDLCSYDEAEIKMATTQSL